MLSILLVTAAALALAGADRTPAVATEAEQTAATAALDPAELVRLSREATPTVARRVAGIRGLRFGSVPEPEVTTGERLAEIERRELERGAGTKGLAADEATVRILGLLEPSEQLEDAVASSGDLAAAAYDPRTDRLYVVSDAVSANEALVEFLLSHELTHALEDQRFGLPDPSATSNDDGALASLALTEGTATAIMVEYAGLHMSPLELAVGSAAVDPSTGDVPAFVVEQLEWAYLGGMEFINELRRVADGWKLVDYALGTRPPASTEQVLHPDKYIRDERPAVVRIDRAELERDGWQLADRGVAGEYSTRQLLELGADSDLAERAAAGWDGDRFELWRRGSAPAGCEASCREDLVLALRWQLESAADARELGRAVGAYIEDGLGGSSEESGAWTIDGGSVAAAPLGDEVTLVFAPETALARSVVASQGAGAAAAGAD